MLKSLHNEKSIQSVRRQVDHLKSLDSDAYARNWLKFSFQAHFFQGTRGALKLVTLKRGKNDRTEQRISSPMKVKSKV